MLREKVILGKNVVFKNEGENKKCKNPMGWKQTVKKRGNCGGKGHQRFCEGGGGARLLASWRLLGY